MKWNNHNITEVLNVYQQYPVLWNIRDKYYCNMRLKEKIIQRFYKDLNKKMLLGGMDLKQLKTKMKSIKDVFRKELHKIEQSKRNGSEEIYSPKLAWFKDAYYLTDVLIKRRSRITLDLLQNKQEPEPSENNATYMESAEYASDAEEHKPIIKMTSSPSPAPPTDRLKMQTEFENIPSEVSYFHQLDPTQNVIEKPYEHFGMYIAAELRQLPQRQAITLQQEIQNCVIRSKLFCLDQKLYLDPNKVVDVELSSDHSFASLDVASDNDNILNKLSVL